jgi:polysaccharide pyruvyl transferase WcaK-like protein
VGAGPLQHKLSRFFIRNALRLANYVSFRDEQSRALARNIGFNGSADVFPDSVYSLEVLPSLLASAECRGSFVVGLAPMAYGDPRRYCVQDAAAYDNLVRTFAAFGSWLSQRHQLKVFSTDICFDADTIAELSEALLREPDMVAANVMAREPITSFPALMSAMSSMDYIVTCRFHGVIFAQLLNIPVIAVSHHQKVATLMADLGLTEYCLDIDTFDLELLKATFDRMVSDTTRIKARLAERSNSYRARLDHQFDRLFPVYGRQSS